MLASDPQNQFEELKAQVISHIGKTFPIRDRTGHLEVRVSDLGVVDTKGTDDIAGQYKAKMEGKSWAAPVMGTVEVVDLHTGKTLVSKPTKIAEIPKMTRQYSYIIGGQEKSITNQWRLRPGVYVKATERPGEYEAQFQLAKGRPFDIQMDESGYLHLKMGTRKIPIYSVLKAYGVSDAAMKKAWGDDAFAASQAKSKPDKDLASLYEVWRKEKPPQGADLIHETKAIFEGTQLDPTIAHANLGVRSDRVNDAVLFEASKKLVEVAAKRQPPDPIDSLRYKELWQAKDLFTERLDRASIDISSRVQKALRNPTLQKRLLSGDNAAVRDVVMPDLIQKPMYHVFATSLANSGKQTNPLSMLSDRSLVTITGPGGIQNPHALTLSNKTIDPSHLGILDPVFTPESDPGVNTHLAFGVDVKDRRPSVRLYNVKTGKMEDVDAATAATSNIVLPDQVKWTLRAGSKERIPVPVGKSIRVSDTTGRMRDDVPWGQVHYVLMSPTQMFSTETNLVPFMGNDAAGRTTMSARHMGQAISVVGREAPLVRVEAGGGKTFEELVGGGFLSRRSKVDGVVHSVDAGKITIKDKSGTIHHVDLYDHYPTNDPKGMLHSEPLVKPGDKVKATQILADNNFTKNGILALGTNLRTAYLANGSNHEDGVVISESAAKKLSSVHLNKPSMLVSDSHIIGKKSFVLSKGALYGKEHLDNVGDDGIVRIGAKVKPGDPLVLALSESTRPESIDSNTILKLSKKLRNKHNNASLVWDGDYEGEVVGIARRGKELTVHVKTFEPAQVGSKISTRHSAKGIVTSVLPNGEMPHDGSGKHVEMLLNPVSVPGRMNAGQILETAAGRIAEKTGKPYVVKNFQGGVDYLKKLQDELKQHGLKDTETLYDPKTGRKLGDITVGPHYAFQLEHQIDKKTHVRSGGRGWKHLGMPMLHYDADTKIPRGGGHTGAQSLGSLGVYAALSAGLHDNLQEMQTLKSDQAQAQEVWGALASGDLMPAPKVPFVAKKFEALLTGMGVNIHKEGAEIRMIPRTDAETRALSRGAITRPTRTIRGKDDQPEKGGLFDPFITGGPAGQHWGHIELIEPMPNPVFSKAIALTLGIHETDIGDIIEGKKTLPNGQFGGKAIKAALAQINLDKELRTTKAILNDHKTRGSSLDKANFKFKALSVLKEFDKHPKDAWTIQAVPVVPPVFRPQSTLPDGTIRNNPLNGLYRRLGMCQDTLKKGEKTVPYASTLDARRGLYNELNNLFGTSPKGKKGLDLDVRGTAENPKKQLPGIIHMISGDVPKDGFFQDKMVGKKQDYTARATIVADPTLSVDELGVPRKIAMELMRPMVAKRLHSLGYDPEAAQLLISKKDPIAMRALEEEVKHRPILMKRDPVLHQYGLVAQNVKLVDSPAIKVSPLILPPLGGDIDGDAVALMVPLSRSAIEEAKRILPSQRILSDSTGDLLYAPSNESALSLYRTSIPRGSRGQVFKTKEEAEKSFKANRLDLGEKIHITGVGATTLGRARIADIVPEKYKAGVLTDLANPVDKKLQGKILTDVAKTDPKHFMEVADGLSRLGFQMAYETGHTVTLKDLEPLRAERGKLVAATEHKVKALLAAGKSQEATEEWLKATRKLHDIYGQHFAGHPTNISDMATSGIKAKREQFQGLVMAPMLVEDHLGRPSAVPITKSFAEGIDAGGYFLQAAGARRGVIQKTESTSEPGYMTKWLVQSAINQPITATDCGTQQGISMSIKDKDVVDRHLAVPLRLGTTTIPAGSVVTPDILRKASAEKVGQIVVRSPLKCRMPQGLCSHCMGVHPSGKEYTHGENVGIIAAQALGERAAQLMLKQTHGQGIVSTSDHSIDEFGDVQRMFSASRRARTDAAVAPSTAKVHKVEAVRRGGWNIWTEGKKKPLYTQQQPLSHVVAGYEPKRGEVLTRGAANMHDILDTQGLDALQNEMVKRIGDIYTRENVLRRHVEVAVRNTTGVMRVEDSGDHPGIIRGDFMMKPVIDEINRTVLKGKEQIKAEPVLLPAKYVALQGQQDWIAQLQAEQLGKTLRTAAQLGHRSTVGGLHPIPTLAYGARTGPKVQQ